MRWRKDFDAWRERRIWQERHQEANLHDIRRALGPGIDGALVLDLGAGMGGLSVAAMLELGPLGLELWAMDYNPDYCRIARLRAERCGLTLPIAAAAGEKLPFPDESFDLVVCLDVLEHVMDPAMVLSEVHRVLKPGGKVLPRPALPPPAHQLAPQTGGALFDRAYGPLQGGWEVARPPGV
jgi:ubiquinone/menaquinone biosynthesis C-methylase UbiE